eukprot:Phypoly_transcript_08660.p1 GENE.Phypoly_transcript_08660~~Phypoly_transcript_08660.p1  ORF type:complete len:409 (-),score=40.01 Phypoly_transcript_08660:102-1328(-)
MVGGHSSHSSPSVVDYRTTAPPFVPSHTLHTYYSPQPYQSYPQPYYPEHYGLAANYYAPPFYPPSYYHQTPKYYPQKTVYYPKPNQTQYYNILPPKQSTPDNSSPEANTEKSSPNGQLPRILFTGTIIIVDSIEKVQPALDELFRDGTAMTHGVGFDMEWKPNFGKGSPRNPTSLIQLSTDKVCVIFWMMYLGNQMPLELFSVLASPHILKIGQSLDCGDNERLRNEFHLDLVNSVDVSIVAKQKGFRKTNLKEQTKVLLGKNLSKFLCTSNWADVHLTPAQIRYAATDPYVQFLIYHKLNELPDAPPPPVSPPDEDEGDGVVDDMGSLSISEKNEPENFTQATKCPHCDRYFMKKVQVYAHLDHAHFDLLPSAEFHSCSLCLKQFRKYTALLIHQEMTGHNPSEQVE